MTIAGGSCTRNSIWGALRSVLTAGRCYGAKHGGIWAAEIHFSWPGRLSKSSACLVPGIPSDLWMWLWHGHMRPPSNDGRGWVVIRRDLCRSLVVDCLRIWTDMCTYCLLFIYRNMYEHIHMYIHAITCKYLCIHILICINIYYKFSWISTYCIYIYICMYSCIYVYVFQNMWISICTHVHVTILMWRKLSSILCAWFNNQWPCFRCLKQNGYLDGWKLGIDP